MSNWFMTEVEFAVQMTCNGCVNAVKKSLQGVDGVKSVDVNLEKEQVIVETTLPSDTIKNLIESTGKRAVIKGYGGTSASHLGAAVAIMEAGSNLIKGVVRMVQSDESSLVIDGTLDGLPPGRHAICVHECGDISDGCKSCGDVLKQFGNGQLTEKVIGELGDITAGENGRAEFRMVNPNLKIWEMIGRSIMIHTDETPKAHQKFNLQNRLVCGIIARSAGLFENTKKICACDGVTQWDERDVPIAGSERQQNKSKM